EGIIIPSAQNATFTISNASSNDEANYTIQVSNRVGSVLSQTAHLTVLVPPFITQNPQGSTNYAGGTLSLSVMAGGTAPLGYQWFFNGTNVPNGTNATLIFTNVLKTRSGDYFATVANSAGSATSSVAHVTVLEAD